MMGRCQEKSANILIKCFLLNWGKKKYNPYKSDPIKFTWKYDREFIFNDLGLYFKNYASIVIKNPYLATEGFLKQTALVWQINPF